MYHCSLIAGVKVAEILEENSSVQEEKRYDEFTGEPYLKKTFTRSFKIGAIDATRFYVSSDYSFIEIQEDLDSYGLTAFCDHHCNEAIGIEVCFVNDNNPSTSPVNIQEKIKEATDKLREIGVAKPAELLMVYYWEDKPRAIAENQDDQS